MASKMILPEGLDKFLAQHGWAGATVVPLAGDASFRRYFRLMGDKGQCVLMDAPPPNENPKPFLAVADWLRSVGLSAPQVLGHDLEKGLLLLSDFGDARLREALDNNPGRERELYELATDVLIHLHRQPPMEGLPQHGPSQWLEELELFTDWYCPAVGIEIEPGPYRSAWTEVLKPVANDGLGPVTVLRDYHAENVMLIDGQVGVSRFGLLDFQDALVGHPAYDLASVLEDARRDVPEDIERAMIDRYCAVTGHDDLFERAYWVLAAQRNTRILGVFTRLWKRDGKPNYRSFQARMWGLLERDLSKPGMQPVRNWFDENIPASARAEAWLEYL